MSYQASEAILKHSKVIDLNLYKLLHYLASYANSDGLVDPAPNQSTMAAFFNVAPRTIRRRLQLLITSGELELCRLGSGPGNPSAYRICSPIDKEGSAFAHPPNALLSTRVDALEARADALEARVQKLEARVEGLIVAVDNLTAMVQELADKGGQRWTERGTKVDTKADKGGHKGGQRRTERRTKADRKADKGGQASRVEPHTIRIDPLLDPLLDPVTTTTTPGAPVDNFDPEYAVAVAVATAVGLSPPSQFGRYPPEQLLAWYWSAVSQNLGTGWVVTRLLARDIPPPAPLLAARYWLSLPVHERQELCVAVRDVFTRRKKSVGGYRFDWGDWEISLEGLSEPSWEALEQPMLEVFVGVFAKSPNALAALDNHIACANMLEQKNPP